MTDYGNAFNAAVAEELRAQRGRKKTTYDTLVASTGLSKSSVIKYLNAQRDIPTPAFIDLCRALDITPQLVFKRAEESIEKN